MDSPHISMSMTLSLPAGASGGPTGDASDFALQMRDLQCNAHRAGTVDWSRYGKHNGLRSS